MKYSDQSYNLRIELDTENCDLNAGEIADLEDALAPLRELVQDFPVSDLYITIQFKPPSHDYRVKVVLRLPGRGLATGDLDEDLHQAFRRCVNKLVHKVNAYKDRLEDSDELVKHEKGTRQDVVAKQPADGRALDQAVAEGNYARFRTLTYTFEEPVRKRAGRWIQRYPEVESQLGETFDLADIVEEVFLNAFERHSQRPREVLFGDWLESLIDPSVKLLSKNPDEELTNIRFARSAVEAEKQQVADPARRGPD
jgi:ribosome-associated translation inhibitor RaiA